MTNKHQLINDFITTWPVERIEKMTLDEYTNLNKSDSFCYWLESRTTEIGGIGGGSAYKFGVFRRSGSVDKSNGRGLKTDGQYGWYEKYGNTAQQAFETVKKHIIKIIDAVKRENYSALDDIDLGHAIKWKIAFLYSGYKLFNIFNYKKLKVIAQKLKLDPPKDISFLELQNIVLQNKPLDEDFFDYSSKIWNMDKDEHTNNNDKQYWLLAPGENAKYWDEFYKEGIVGLGWDDMGDLSQYSSKEEVKQALIELNMGDNPYNATAANWEFVNDMQEGDIIIVKKGRNTLLGYGEVVTDYYYNENRSGYKSCRDVKWIKKGVWPIGHSLVLKTLTNITSYDSKVEKGKKYYKYLLEQMDSDKLIYKVEFKQWLFSRTTVKSNKTNSYIKALEILSTILDRNIFEMDDLDFLEEFYKDVIKEQRLENGKYHHQDAPSYGKNGYYSAAVKEYIVFHQTRIVKSDHMMDLLNYKKQIILQGPPGTGKTRKAKQIARSFIPLTEQRIKEKIQAGLQISTVKGEVIYTIKSNENNKIVLEREKGTANTITYSKILDSFRQEKWNNEVDNNDDRMAVAVAKYLFDNLLVDNSQFKLIQFHPSFTYEDFVRGIVSKPNEDGEGILYEAENKILADFAQKALENYTASQIKPVKKETEEVFGAFITYIKDEIAQSDDHKYPITDAVYLFTADETRFKYKGDKWVAHQKGLNMKFSELKKIIDNGAKERQDIKKMTELEELSRQHATYFIKVVERYREFEKSFHPSSKVDEPVKLLNYVLVVDEINRANLSSVLGELIYALEYRGEAVESMYKVEDDNRLELPKNLYIIGTMNTADRSVGHIDYAIRRRFAFVDLLPNDLSEDESLNFASDLFLEVKNLFTTDDYQSRSAYLSQEFEPKDVALGHSYFIDKSDEGGSIDIRLEYEIKPILFEYVKDGILKENSLEKIRSLQVS